MFSLSVGAMLCGTTEKLTVERVLLVPCEQSTRVENEIEAVDLQGQVEVFSRGCEAIMVWEANSDFFEFGKVFAWIFPSACTVYSNNQVVETVGRVHCVDLGRQWWLEESREEVETEHSFA